MLKKLFTLNLILPAIVLTLILPSLSAADGLPTRAKLTEALKSVVGTKNGGFELNMWATVVDRDGIVKAVTFSGRPG